MRESNINEVALANLQGRISILSTGLDVIKTKCLDIVKEILNTCKDKTLTFSDKDDDDDNFSVNVLVDGKEENVMVRNVHIGDCGLVFIKTEDDRDWYFYEVHVDYDDLVKYMLDEIKHEIEHENDEDEFLPYICPNCGEQLRKGEVEYDYDSGQLLVAHCPWCGEEGRPVKNLDDDDEQ